MEITKENLVLLMRFRPSLKDVANYFGVSEDTIDRRCKDWGASSFREFREIHSFQVKMKLIEKALEMASNGNSKMLAFCLKNYAGWQENPEPVIEKKIQPIPLAYVPLSQRNKLESSG